MGTLTLTPTLTLTLTLTHPNPNPNLTPDWRVSSSALTVLFFPTHVVCASEKGGQNKGASPQELGSDKTKVGPPQELLPALEGGQETKQEEDDDEHHQQYKVLISNCFSINTCLPIHCLCLVHRSCLCIAYVTSYLSQDNTREGQIRRQDIGKIYVYNIYTYTHTHTQDT